MTIVQNDRRLYQMLSIIERKHGLTALDCSARALLDLIVSRELKGYRTTARDLIEVSGKARAVVYRKLNSLKQGQWIQEHWHDFKLCYTTSSELESLIGSLEKRFG
jgi:hypothetical protein